MQNNMVASGYPDYVQMLCKPEFSTAMLEAFESNTILPMIARSTFVSANGGALFIQKKPNFAFRKHQRDGRLKHDTLVTTMVKVEDNRSMYYSYKVASEDLAICPEIEKIMANLGSAAFDGMVRGIEQEVFAVLPLEADAANRGNNAGLQSAAYDLGDTGAPVYVTAADVLDVLANAESALNEQNIPQGNRFIVLPVIMANLLQRSELRGAHISGLPRSTFLGGSSLLEQELCGFKIYVSNSVPTVFDPAISKDCYQILFGHTDAIAFKVHSNESRRLEDKDAFDVFFQGKARFSVYPVYPEALGRLYVNVA